MVKAFRHPAEPPLDPTPHTRGKLLDWLAPFYDWLCPKMGIGLTFRNRTLLYAGLKPGEHVLDVGCGTGVLTRLAAEVVGPSGRVIGIDPGPRMIAIAGNNAAHEKSSVEFRLAAIEDLPFEDSSFECVLSSFMIHHLPPDLKHKGLAEVYRVLKPGGRLLAVDIGRPSNPLWWILIWPFLFWSFTKDHVAGRLIGYFQEAGFYPVETVGQWGGLVSFWLAYRQKDFIASKIPYRNPTPHSIRLLSFSFLKAPVL